MRSCRIVLPLLALLVVGVRSSSAQVWVGYPDTPDFFSHQETIPVSVQTSWPVVDPEWCAPAESGFSLLDAYQDDYWTGFGSVDYFWIEDGWRSYTAYDNVSSSEMWPIDYGFYSEVTYRVDEWFAFTRSDYAQRRVLPRHCTEDLRSLLVQEYLDFVQWAPQCDWFTSSRGTAYYSFDDLNGWYPIALLYDGLMAPASSLAGLDMWRWAYGAPRHINSAYRSPVHNQSVGGAGYSAHMFGFAVDWRNESNSTAEYWDMYNAAVLADADYIEELSGPCGLGCTHADWRSHPGDYYE